MTIASYRMGARAAQASKAERIAIESSPLDPDLLELVRKEGLDEGRAFSTNPEQVLRELLHEYLKRTTEKTTRAEPEHS